jgi:hypothetical protein
MEAGLQPKNGLPNEVTTEKQLRSHVFRKKYAGEQGLGWPITSPTRWFRRCALLLDQLVLDPEQSGREPLNPNRTSRRPPSPVRQAMALNRLLLQKTCDFCVKVVQERNFNARSP